MKEQETLPVPGTPIEERWMHGATDEAGHRGKGPKNYQRDDERVFEDVGEELTQNDGVDASDIEIAVAQGEVTLDGTVETVRMKEMAEESVTKLPGVKSVRNLLRTKKNK